MYLRSVLILSLILVACQVSAKDDPKLETLKDKASYSFGFNIGNNMQKQSAEIDPDILLLGLKDGLSGKEPKISEQERQDVMSQFQMETMAKLGEKNKQEGEKFLAENKKKKGVVSLPSGLQYKVISKGKGEKPKLTDKVKTHYRGTLIDGSEFDSSIARGEPITFPLNQVIPGWTEALQLMETGAKWQLFVPADLAYGSQGRPGIPPNSTLVFEVELISIEK